MVAADRQNSRLPAGRLLQSQSGAFDLTSVLIGAAVVAILVAGTLATVFGIIPWSQDHSARQDLSSVKTAEGVAKVRLGGFKEKDGLLANQLMSDANTVAVGSDAQGTCYVGISKSATGNVYFSTDTAPDPLPLTSTTVTGCIDTAKRDSLVAQVGGLGAGPSEGGSGPVAGGGGGAPDSGGTALPAGYTWTDGVMDTNVIGNPAVEGNAAGWSKPTSPYQSVVKSFGYAPGQGINGSGAVEFVATGTIQDGQSNVIAYDLPNEGYGQIVMSISSPSSSNWDVYAEVANFAADGSLVSLSYPGSGYVGADNSWITLRTGRPTLPTPAGGSLKLLVRAAGNWTNPGLEDTKFYIDNVSSTDNGIDYFDGNTAAAGEYTYKWTGAVNGSTSQQITTKQLALPSAITLGQDTTVMGRGFPANTQVTLEDNDCGDGYTQVTTDADGSFTAVMNFPANTDPDAGVVAGPGTLYVFSGWSSSRLFVPVTYQ